MSFVFGLNLNGMVFLFFDCNVILVNFIGLVKINDSLGGDDINIVLFLGVDVLSVVWVKVEKFKVIMSIEKSSFI